MDESEWHAQGVGNTCRSLCATRVGRDDHAVIDATMFGEDVLLNVLLEQVSAVQIVHWYVEEALILWVVKVHRDDMVGAGAGQEVCNQSTSLSNPLLVPALHIHWRRCSCVIGVTC